MQIHEIKREHAQKKKKTVGRGGKRGKTAGRGGKGQTARAGNKRRPALRDVIKKLPKLRGHGKNRSKSVFDRGPVAVVNVSELEVFDTKTEITEMILITSGLVDKVSGRIPTIKILGHGDLTKALTISGLAVSASAKEKIETAGGKVIEIVKEVKESKKAKKAEALVKEAEVKEKKEKVVKEPKEKKEKVVKEPKAKKAEEAK